MIRLRRLRPCSEFAGDFLKVRDFLVRINQHQPAVPGFPWGRWEWFFSLDFNALDPVSLSRVGIWEDDGQIVALATYEGNFGEAYLVLDPAYGHLRADMLAHAGSVMAKDGRSLVLLPDNDPIWQLEAARQGYRPGDRRESNAMFEIQTTPTDYELPADFHIVSLADEYSLEKYNRVLWYGFNHPGDPPDSPEAIASRRLSLSGPDVDLQLKIAVRAPNGEFAAYCGMWYLVGTPDALVEPVATDPRYRRMGLGRAAVLEGIRRCGERGAIRAFVGSDQQFYTAIGFKLFSTETFWEKDRKI